MILRMQIKNVRPHPTLCKTMAVILFMFLLSVVSQNLVYMMPPTVGLSLSSESDKLALLALKHKLTDMLYLYSYHDYGY